jgi:hypothetical protein
LYLQEGARKSDVPRYGLYPGLRRRGEAES